MTVPWMLRVRAPLAGARGMANSGTQGRRAAFGRRTAGVAALCCCLAWILLLDAVSAAEDEQRQEPDETSLQRGLKAKQVHDSACYARFPMMPKVYLEISHPRECWFDRQAGPTTCAMNEPLYDLWRAAHDAKRLNESFGDLWSTLLPMFVSGYVDAMGMDARQLDQLVKMRGVHPSRAQSTLVAVARLSWFMRAYRPLSTMLGNEELRHAAILYHARHSVVSPKLLAIGPPVNDTDLAAWHDLYDSMGGPKWVTCRYHRERPCECPFVFCEFQLRNASEFASPDDDEVPERSWRTARWRPHEKMPPWKVSRQVYPWLNEYTLRIVVIALVEEHGAVGTLPPSIKFMTALRALTLTSMAGSIANACTREMSTRILGQLRLRYLSVDFHLAGLGDHDRSGLEPLPLHKWLRSLTVDLSGASSTADPSTEWVFTQHDERKVNMQIVDEEMKRHLKSLRRQAAQKAWEDEDVDVLAAMSDMEDDVYGEDLWKEDDEDEQDNAEEEDVTSRSLLVRKAIREEEKRDGGEEAYLEGNEEEEVSSSASVMMSAFLDGPLGFGEADMFAEQFHQGMELEAATAGPDSSVEEFVQGKDSFHVRNERGEGKRSFFAEPLMSVNPSVDIDASVVKAAVGPERWAAMSESLGMDPQDMLRVMRDVGPGDEPDPFSSGGGGQSGRGNRLAKSLSRLHQPAASGGSNESVVSPLVTVEEVGELLDATLVLATASVLEVRQLRRSNDTSGGDKLDKAIQGVLAAVIRPKYTRRQWKLLTKTEEDPWFFGGWSWRLTKSPPVPPRAVIAATVQLSRVAQLTPSETRTASFVAMDALTLANALAEVELGATTHVCAPEALSPSDVEGALEDAHAEVETPLVFPTPSLGDAYEGRRVAATSLAYDRLHAYQARVPGAHPPRSLRWVCSFHELRRVGITGSPTGLPSCFGEAMEHLVELDVRGCRLGSDPLISRPFPRTMELLGDTLRGFIAFHQSPRFCPPPGAHWNDDGLALDLTVFRRFQSQSANVGESEDAVDGGLFNVEATSAVSEDDGVLPPSWAQGYNSSSLGCRPLFELLSDNEGFDPGWQCVNVRGSDSETSEGWAFQFNDTHGEHAMPWWKWHRLEKFWIDGNFAYGTIPRDIGELWPNMRTLDLYSNSLVGEIPAEIGKMKQLHQLQLQHNRLSGTLPPRLLHPDTFPLLLVLHLQLNRNLTGCVDPNAFVEAAGGPSGRSSMLAAHTQGSQVKLGRCL
jgi:hypothetical protein